MSKDLEILKRFIGAQNQRLQDDISKQGYKDDSPYKNNPFNTIYGTPQGTPITMKGVSTPLIGIDEFGNKQHMMPGQEYQFPGSKVTETPIAQMGGAGMMYADRNYAEGGKIDPPKGKKPLYVESKNDPRYKAYQDSLVAYTTLDKYKNIPKNIPFKKEDEKNIRKIWASDLEPLARDFSNPRALTDRSNGNIERADYFTPTKYKKPQQPVIVKPIANRQTAKTNTKSKIRNPTEKEIKEWSDPGFRLNSVTDYFDPVTKKVSQSWFGDMTRNEQAIKNNLQPAGLVQNGLNTNTVTIQQPVRVPQYYDVVDTNNQTFGGGETFYKSTDLSDLNELPTEGWSRKTTPHYQNGGDVDLDAMRGMMKSKIGMGNALGHPAIKRMSQAMPKTGMTPEGMGTHYMSSMGEYAVPLLQDTGKDQLEYFENPEPSSEDIRFNSPEEAQYFAEHYKEVAPMSTIYNGLQGYQEGGETWGKNLTPKQLQLKKEVERNNRKFETKAKWDEHFAQEKKKKQAKAWVANSMQEAYKSPLMSPGYFTPEGALIGAMQAGFQSGKDLSEGEYKSAAMHAGLAALPFAPQIIKTAAPIVQKAGKALGAEEGLLGKVTNEININRSLNKIKKEGQLQGLSDHEIAKNQMKQIGITSNQRKAYTPLVSEFAERYVTPRNYSGTGASGQNKFQEIIENIKKGGYKEAYPERIDSWRLYLGRPQLHKTFAVADTAPSLHQAYKPGSLEGMDIYNIRSRNTTDAIGFNSGYNPNNLSHLDILENPMNYGRDNSIMGGYNKILTKDGTQYNDVWDLHPEVTLKSLFPSKISENSKLENIFYKTFPNGVQQPRGFKVPIEKFVGKSFMSHGNLPYTSTEHVGLLKENILSEIENLKPNVETAFAGRQRMAKMQEDLKALENYPKHKQGGVIKNDIQQYQVAGTVKLKDKRYDNRPIIENTEQHNSIDRKGVLLALKERQDALKDAHELKTTGQIKRPRSAKYTQSAPRQAELKAYVPQSTVSKTWEVATHPMTAFGYAARNEELPDHFSNGPINAHEQVVDMVNPFFYADQAGQLVKNVATGHPLDAAGNALSILPVAAEFSPQIRQGLRLIGNAASPANLRNTVGSYMMDRQVAKGLKPVVAPRLRKIDLSDKAAINVKNDIARNLTPEQYDKLLADQYAYNAYAFDNPIVEFKGYAQPSSFALGLGNRTTRVTDLERRLGEIGIDSKNEKVGKLFKEKFCAPGSECAKSANAVTSRTYTDITGKPFLAEENAHNAWHMQDQMTRHGGEDVTGLSMKVGDRVLMGNGVDQSTYVPGYIADRSVRHAGMYAGVKPNANGDYVPLVFESGKNNAMYINPFNHTFTGFDTAKKVIRPAQLLDDQFGKSLVEKNLRYAFRDKPSVANYSSSNKAAQQILDDTEKHREVIKRTHDITNDEFDELRNSLIGIGAQETKLNGALPGSGLAKAKIQLQNQLTNVGLTEPIKRTMNVVKQTLNNRGAVNSNLPKFPGTSVIEMEAAQLSKNSNMPFEKALAEVKSGYQPQMKYMKSTPTSSKGMFRQKFQTEADRVSGLGKDLKNKNSIENGLGQMAENYATVKKLYPDANPRQLMDLTTLMWNSPGKVKNKKLVDFYLFGKDNPDPSKFNFDYIRKINNAKDDLINIHPQRGASEPYYNFFRNNNYPEIQYQEGGELPQAQFGEWLTDMKNKVTGYFDDEVKPVVRQLPVERTLHIRDKRKIRGTSGQPIRPTVDLLSGDYDSVPLDKTLREAKRQNLSKDDMWNLASMALAETGLGKKSYNIGQVEASPGEEGTPGPYEFVHAYIKKMKDADRFKITDPARRLQVYNGDKLITQDTEKNLRGGSKMQMAYGVPVPKQGISMKKRPLYGINVLDVRKNVLEKHPEFVRYMDSIYKAPVNQKGGLVKTNNRKL